MYNIICMYVRIDIYFLTIILYSSPNSLQDDKLQYVNTLKPKYSSVDLTEVELPEMENNVNNAHSDVDREDENTNMLLDVCIYLFI